MNTSPWNDTEVDPNSLLVFRKIPVSRDDMLYSLESKFTYRPDLLANAVYSDPKLWWVFMNRNLDIIRDPIFDFVPGLQFYVPKKETIIKLIGG